MGLTPAFSTHAIMLVPHFPLPHFQSPQHSAGATAQPVIITSIWQLLVLTPRGAVQVRSSYVISVRPEVRHTHALCLNDTSYRLLQDVICGLWTDDSLAVCATVHFL